MKLITLRGHSAVVKRLYLISHRQLLGQVVRGNGQAAYKQSFWKQAP